MRRPQPSRPSSELPTGTPTTTSPTSKPTTETPPQSSNDSEEGNGDNLTTIIGGTVMGAVTLVMGIVIVILCQRGQRQPVVSPTSNPVFDKPSPEGSSPAVTLKLTHAEKTHTTEQPMHAQINDAETAADPTHVELADFGAGDAHDANACEQPASGGAAVNEVPPRAPQCDTVGFVRDQHAALEPHSTYDSADTEA